MGITDPFAATRLLVLLLKRSELEAGKTDSSAPESMRKSFPDVTSRMEMEEVDEGNGVPAAAISDRPWRLPVSSEQGGAWDIASICKSMLWAHILHE